MMQSELLLQTSWPTQSYFHSNLDHYGPNLGFYENEHYEFPSPINSTPENSLNSSESHVPILSDGCVEYPLLGYDQMQNLDDVCRWLCEDEQGIEEIQSERSIEGDDMWSPDLSMKSSEMELESETVLPNLLKAYSDAMDMEQTELAKVIVRCISEKVNPIGSAIDRIAFNLFRCAENQEEYLRQESIKNFKTAFRAFYDIFPYGKFAHFTANSAIIEAVPSHVESVYIVDFDLGEGIQWPLVIEAIAQKRKSLTIVSVKLEEHDSGFEETKWQLFNYARSLGLNLKIEKMDMAQLVKVMENKLKNGREFVAFNCMIGLPHMGRTRGRTQALEFIKIAKGILAKTEGIITFGDGEDGKRMENCSNYTSFFDGNLAHYRALYESLEWGFPSYLTEARIAMETLFVAPSISSLSWFQKSEEVREEVVSRKDLGLKGRSMSRESSNEARELVKEEESPYGIRIEGDNGNEMVLEWRGTPLVKVSAWV